MDEFKNNRSTKIPQKEVHALMQELFDAYELDSGNQMDDEGGPYKGKGKRSATENEAELNTSHEGETPCEERTPASTLCLTLEQRNLLSQQMRQHTQQLTQMALVSARDPTWTTMHQHAKEMLSDLVQVIEVLSVLLISKY